MTPRAASAWSWRLAWATAGRLVRACRVRADDPGPDLDIRDAVLSVRPRAEEVVSSLTGRLRTECDDLLVELRCRVLAAQRADQLLAESEAEPVSAGCRP